MFTDDELKSNLGLGYVAGAGKYKKSPVPSETYRLIKLSMDRSPLLKDKFSIVWGPTAFSVNLTIEGQGDTRQDDHVLFIAKNLEKERDYRLVIRGAETVGNFAEGAWFDSQVDWSTIDTSASPGMMISAGLNAALTAIINDVNKDNEGAGTSLTDAVAALAVDGESVDVTVTGNSLGGGITTPLMIYLKNTFMNRGDNNGLRFHCCKFAAPTFTSKTFAEYALTLIDNSESENGYSSNYYSLVNTNDFVPNLWDPEDTLDFLPVYDDVSPLSDKFKSEITQYCDYIKTFIKEANWYAQVSTTDTFTSPLKQTTSSFDQIGYQHGCYHEYFSLTSATVGENSGATADIIVISQSVDEGAEALFVQLVGRRICDETREVAPKYNGPDAERAVEDMEWYWDVDKESVSLDYTDKSGNSQTLYGWYLDNGSNSTAIVCHGYNACGRLMGPWLKTYYDMGFNVLTPDLRGHGRSTEDAFYMGTAESDDMLNWVNFLTDRNGSDHQIHLFGISLGGAVVLGTALKESLPDNVKTITTDATPANMQLVALAYIQGTGVLNDFSYVGMAQVVGNFQTLIEERLGFGFADLLSLEKLSGIKTPLLLIHGAGDTSIPPDTAVSIFSTVPVNEKCYFLIESANHPESVEYDYDGYHESIRYFVENHESYPLISGYNSKHVFHFDINKDLTALTPKDLDLKSMDKTDGDITNGVKIYQNENNSVYFTAQSTNSKENTTYKTDICVDIPVVYYDCDFTTSNEFSDFNITALSSSPESKISDGVLSIPSAEKIAIDLPYLNEDPIELTVILKAFTGKIYLQTGATTINFEGNGSDLVTNLKVSDKQIIIFNLGRKKVQFTGYTIRSPL